MCVKGLVVEFFAGLSADINSVYETHASGPRQVYKNCTKVLSGLTTSRRHGDAERNAAGVNVPCDATLLGRREIGGGGGRLFKSPKDMLIRSRAT